MFLDERDLAELSCWRRKLHRAPELSGEEGETAREVQSFLAPSQPDSLLSELGGHGVAAIYQGAEPGPTLIFRAELDALPIEELSEAPYRSATPGKAHLCGHDGHMATLAGLALGLGRRRPRRGRAVLLFQPAEETGDGAAAVVSDPKFVEIRPDLSFAYHNLPGLPLGHVALAEGPVNCASRGLRIALSGKTAHASMPEFGVSPMAAIARLMPELTSLGGGAPENDDFAMVTVTHARMGEPTFGVAPGYGEIWATLRTRVDARMDALREAAERRVREAAAASGLDVSLSYQDVFEHCENSPVAVSRLRAALEAEGVPYDSGRLPMRGSEDFGRFGKIAPAAMFFLGAGKATPACTIPITTFPTN